MFIGQLRFSRGIFALIVGVGFFGFSQLASAQTVYGPYTFDADNDADESAWTFVAPGGAGLNVSNTPSAWSWDNNDTASANLGPTSGQGGNPDGYVYTESSGLTVPNSVFTMTHNVTLDAVANNWEIDFYWNQRGNSNVATVEVQTNENGAGWVTQATFAEDGPDVLTSGVQQWNRETFDLTGLISDSSTQIRLRVVSGGLDPLWNNDFGLDTITITGRERLPSGTFSGRLFSDEGMTPVTTTKTINLVVGTSTPSVHSTTTDSNGDFVFTLNSTSSLEAGTPVLFYIDGDANDANTIDKIADVNFGIYDLNLYYDHVIVKQEGATTTTFAEITFYDSTDDDDILYTASSSADSLETANDSILYIWPEDIFIVGASTTLNGSLVANGRFISDGTLTLAGAGESVGGQLIGATRFPDLVVSGSYTLNNEAAFSSINILSGGSFVAPAILGVQNGLTIDGAFDANGGQVQFANGGGFGVAEAVYTDSLSLTAQELAPGDLAFNNDGTKVFVIGLSGNAVDEWSLSTAFDVSTATYVDSLSVFAEETQPTGIAFNNDGSNMYIVGQGGDEVDEWSLSVPFDVSTGSYIDSLDISAQEEVPWSLDFSNDGTKLFITGFDLVVDEWSLSVPFDVSTGSYVDSLDVSAEETDPTGIEFSNDGTKLFIVGPNGKGVDEWRLAEPFDVSTGVYFDTLHVGDQEALPYGLAFNNDGSKLYIVGFGSPAIDEWTIPGVGYHSGDLDLAEVIVLSGVQVFESAATTSNIAILDGATLRAPSTTMVVEGGFVNEGLFDSNRGELFLTGTAQTLVGNLSIESQLFNVTVSGSYTFANNALVNDLTIDTGGSLTAPANLSIDGDYTNNGSFDANSGTVRFIATSFDVTDAVLVDGLDVSAEQADSLDMAFNLDGTKLFVLGATPSAVDEWALSTPYDLGTASYTDSLSVSSQEATSTGLAFNNDGTKLFVIGTESDSVHEWTLSTAFDISTASYVDSLDVSSEETVPGGMAFNADGTMLYVTGSVSQTVIQYELSPAFDVSAGVFDGALSVAAREPFPTDIEFSADGLNMFVAGPGNGAIQLWRLNAPFEIDGLTYLSSFSADDGVPFLYGMTFNASGTRLYTVGPTGYGIKEYALDDGPQELSGSMVGTDAFFRLVNPGNLTTTFTGPASTTNDFIIEIIGSTTIKFNANDTYTFTGVNISGTSSSSPVSLISSTPGTDWFLDTSEVKRIVNAYIKDSDACQSAGGGATSSASIDGGNNTCWVFSDDIPVNVRGFLLRDTSGEVVTTPEEITLVIATTTGQITRTAITDNFGIYNFFVTDDNFNQDDIVAVYLNDQIKRGITITKAVEDQNLTAFNLYYDLVSINQYGDTAMTNADIALIDNDYDSDINFDASTTSNSLSILRNNSLLIAPNSTFNAPDYASTSDLVIATNATFTAPAVALSVDKQLLNQDGVFDANGGTTYFTGGIGFANLIRAEYTDSLSVGVRESSPYDLLFNPDGTKLYVTGFNGAAVDEWNLSVPFDVSTATYFDTLPVSAQSAFPLGIDFNHDGTKLFVSDYTGGQIDEWSLGTPYDVSTGTYTDSLTVSAQITNPLSFTISDDGTRLHVSGDAQTIIAEWALSTPYDVSTGVYVDQLQLLPRENLAMGIAFNELGSRLFIAGVGTAAVQVWSLAARYDVSTAFYTGQLDISGQTTGITGIEFNDTGSKLYVISDQEDQIDEWEIPRAAAHGSDLVMNDVVILDGAQLFLGQASTSDFTVASGARFTTADAVLEISGDINNDGIFNAPIGEIKLTGLDNTVDGSFVGESGFNNLNITGQYTFSTNATTSDFRIGSTASVTAPALLSVDGDFVNEGNFNAGDGTVYASAEGFDIMDAFYSDELLLSGGQAAISRGLTFNNDGSKMFLASVDVDEVSEWNLAVPFDIATASFVDSLDVSSQDGNPIDVAFNNEGTKLYVAGADTGNIYEWSLSSSFDISTAVFLDSLNVSAEETVPLDMNFNNDGTKLYVLGQRDFSLDEWSLTTPFDVSTGVYQDTLDVGATGLLPYGSAFSNDGLSLFTIGFEVEGGFVQEWSLAVPYDTSTGVFVDSLNISDRSVRPFDIEFNNDGSAFYVVAQQFGAIIEYAMDEPQSFGGSMVGDNAFNNLVDSGELPLTFSSSASTTGDFVSVHSLPTSVTFNASSTYTFENFNVQGSDSDSLVSLVSSVSDSEWFLNVPGAATTSWTIVQDSNACGSAGGGLSASSTLDAGNNTCWTFSAIVGGVSVRGTIYSDRGISPLTAEQVLTLAIGHETPILYVTNSETNGTYRFDVFDGDIATSTPLVVYVSGSPTTTGAVVTKAISSTDDILNLNIFVDHVVLDQQGTSSLSNVELAVYDSTNDSDVPYAASSTLNRLDIPSADLFVTTATTFNAPTNASTSGLIIQTSATFTAPSQGLTINGDLVQNGVFDINGGEVFFAGGEGFNIATAKDNGELYDFGRGNILPYGLAFNDDGTKAYMSENFLNVVYAYDLSTPFDLNTASDNNESFNMSSQTTTPFGIEFNNDGSKFYVVGRDNRRVFAYDLSIAFDVSTATYNSESLNVVSQDNVPLDLAFNNDGTRLFVTGDQNDSVYTYVLTTPFDLTTASFNSEDFSVNSEDSSPSGIAFNDTGTRMYITGNFGNKIVTYELTTPFDVTSAVHIFETVGLPDSANPFGVDFNNTGDKLYYMDFASDTFYAYDLDLVANHEGDLVLGTTTITNNQQRFIDNATTSDLTILADGTLVAPTTTLSVTGDLVNNGVLDANRGTLNLSSDDGTVSGNLTSNSSLYDLRVDGTVTFSGNASTSNNLTVNTSATLNAPALMSVGGDYVNEGVANFSDNNTTLYSTADLYDINTAVYSGTALSVAAQGAAPIGLEFNPDGTKLFVYGFVNETIYAYDLSVPYEITTASYNAESFAINGQETTPYGFTFSSAGDKLYVIGPDNDTVYAYDLATAFDVSTATYSDNSFSVSGQDSIALDVAINTDGTKLYVIGFNSATVYAYDLTTPFDVSTASYNNESHSFGVQDTQIYGMTMSSDGSKLFALGSNYDTVFAYNLATPFDLLTASYAEQSFFVGNQEGEPLDVFFANGVNKMFVTGATTNFIYSYDLEDSKTFSGTMTGSSAFHNFSRVGDLPITFTSAASTTGDFVSVLTTPSSITFNAGDTYTFENFQVQGAPNATSSLVSSASGTDWFLDVPGTSNAEYLYIQDSDACSSDGGGLTATSSTDGGNNTCWTFVEVEKPKAWNSSDWTTYDTVTIDPANIDEDLTDFPVYIDLADLSATFWATTPTGASLVGTDIRVTTDGGSPAELPRELVFASSTLETGELHFKAPLISSTTDTVFRVYYNGTTTGDYARADTYGTENVWTNGYVGVWHMNQDPTVSGMLDSTFFNNPSTNFGAMTSTDLVNTNLGRGIDFDGTNDYMRVSPNLPTTNYNYSVWFDPDTTNDEIVLMASGATTGNNNEFILEVNANIQRTAFNNTGATLAGVETISPTAGSYHMVSQRNGSALEQYVNAQLDGTNTNGTALNFAGCDMLIGTDSDSGCAGNLGNWANGVIDEIRVSSEARSASWISAEYLNQSTTTDFYAVGQGAETGLNSTILSNHDSTQVSNAFNFQNKADEPLFVFKFENPSLSNTVTNLILTLSGVKEIDQADFSNIRLWRDTDNDAEYDAGDTELSTGVMSITGDEGTITFSTTFTSSTSANYLVTADWNAPDRSSSMNINLYGGNITATDIDGTHDFLGEVRRAQHGRLAERKGGGGSNVARVGTPAPPGDGIVTGGTNDGGEQIGSNPNYFLPTANSGSWTNPENAYDGIDGTYATANTAASSSFQNHNFSVAPTNSIEGVEVKLEVSGTTGAGTIDVELSYDGGTSWTTVKTTPTLTTTDTVVTLGGPSDTWGRSWAPADFSNANFRVRLTASPSANTVQVDAIQVRVYNQATGGGSGGGGRT